MSQFALRLPESLAESIKRLARENRVSMNQYVMMTLAEQVGRVDTTRYFAQRRARANPQRALEVLARTPSTQPSPGDELPGDLRARVDQMLAKRKPRAKRATLSAPQVASKTVAGKRPTTK